MIDPVVRVRVQAQVSPHHRLLLHPPKMKVGGRGIKRFVDIVCINYSKTPIANDTSSSSRNQNATILQPSV